MSISKSISLNFSNGVKTVYTTSATLYIPFEVSYIRIANTYFEPTGAVPLDAVIISNLVDNDVIAQVKQFSIPNCIKHIFNVPRPINGTYDFSINLSNTIDSQVTTSRTGYSLIGTIGIGTTALILNTVTSPDSDLLSLAFDSFIIPGSNRIIKTGVGPYVLGTNAFTCLDYDLLDTITVSELANGTLTEVNWFMDGNLLTISLGLTTNIGANSFSNDYTPQAVIKNYQDTDTEGDRYRLTTVPTYSIANVNITWHNPAVYKYYNLTKGLVLIDLEFYENYKIPRVIKNSQYYLWSFTDTTFTDLKNIDVLFPVDEIQIVNFNGHTTGIPAMYSIYSDLVQSSTTDYALVNKNYTNTLATMVQDFSPYNVNRKKFCYETPRIINGGYSLYAKSVLDNISVDYTNDLGVSSFQIHILFLEYEK